MTNTISKIEIEAKDMIAWYRGNGLTDDHIKDFLMDGEALAEEGYSDKDQELIDCAYAILNKKEGY